MRLVRLHFLQKKKNVLGHVFFQSLEQYIFYTQKNNNAMISVSLVAQKKI